MMPVWSQNHISNQTFAALISSLRVLQRVWKPKKPKQCDCLSGSGYLPPHSHPGDPKPHGEHRCFPIHFTGPPFPNGPGSPYPRPTGHTWRCPEGKDQAWARRLSSLIQQNRTTRGYSVSQKSHRVFSPEGAWRHTETSQETTASL